MTGTVLGVAMLATRFPRPPGDIGNPATFPFPVLYERVAEASVAAVVRPDGAPRAIEDALAAAAERLVRRGATLIATSCGFLSPLQARLERDLPVPVITSSLALLPLLRTAYGPAPIAVLTFDSRRLTPLHLGPDSGPAVIAGIEGGRALYRAIAEDRPDLDTALARQDAVDAALAAVARSPDCAAVLLECTNLSPYRDAIASAVERPVHDLNSALIALGRELSPSQPADEVLRMTIERFSRPENNRGVS